MNPTEFKFYEEYVLSNDKPQFLKKLLSGTEAYYYFNLLHALKTQGANLQEKDLKSLKSFLKNGSQKAKSIKLRHLLTKFDAAQETEEKNEIIDEIASEFLKLNFHYPQPTGLASSKLTSTLQQLPSELKSTLFDINIEETCTDLAYFDNLTPKAVLLLDPTLFRSSPREIIERYLSVSAKNDSSNMLEILKLADTIFKRDRPQLIEELDSNYFANLTLDQLKELERHLPNLHRSKNFFQELFTRQFPSIRTKETAKEWRDILQKIRDWSAAYIDVFPTFHKETLFELLKNGVELGDYDLDLFLQFLADPHQQYSGAAEKQKKSNKAQLFQDSDEDDYQAKKSSHYASQSKANYRSDKKEQLTKKEAPTRKYVGEKRTSGRQITEPRLANLLVDRVGPQLNVDSLIRRYLEEFFKTATTLSPFDEFISPKKLSEIYTEVKLYSGEELAELGKSFTPEVLRNMNEAKEIVFLKSNKKTFARDDPVVLAVQVKNIPTLIVNVFEVLPENYYRNSHQQIRGTMNLDGLITQETQTLTFTDPQIQRRTIHLKFESITRRQSGVFIIELIGNGISCRALIKKGRLYYIQRNTISGHEVQIFDEKHELCKGKRVGLWIDNKFHQVNEEGRVIIPYAEKANNYTTILVCDDFAELSTITIQQESYEFKCSYIYNHESFLMGNKAKIIVQPRLYVNNTPASLDLVQDTKITVTTYNEEDNPTVTHFSNKKLTHKSDLELDFPIPGKLQRIQVRVTGQILLLLKADKQQISSEHTIEMHLYKDTNKFFNQYLKRTDEGYSLYVLGKNGEPKTGVKVELSIKHEHFNNPITQTLQTDAKGRVVLGRLNRVLSLTSCVKAEFGDFTEHFRISASDSLNFPNDIKLTEGDQLVLPMLHNDLDVKKVTLHHILNNRPAALLNSTNLQLSNQKLTISGLKEGVYRLKLRDLNKTIMISVLKGSYKLKHSFILADNNLYEVRNQTNNIVVEGVELVNNKGQVDLKAKIAADDVELTRVHVFAYQFVRNQNHTGVEGLRSNVKIKALESQKVGLRDSEYFKSRQLGGEYVYVLDRQHQNRYIGNTLEKPRLFLKKTYVRDTEMTEEALQDEDDDESSMSDSQEEDDDDFYNEMDKRKAKKKKGISKSKIAYKTESMKGSKRMYDYKGDKKKKKECTDSDDDEFYSTNKRKVDSLLNFLAHPCQVYANLRLNDSGHIHISNFPAEKYAAVQIIATNLTTSISYEFPLKNNQIQTKDLRMKSELKKDSFYSIARGSETAEKGQILKIKDLTSTEIQVIDSISKLFEVLKQLHASGGQDGQSIATWEFLKDWNQKTFAEKLDKYDEFASNEMNIFLYFKDKEFFTQVVKPFVSNKIKKQFVDYFLLEETKRLTEYAKVSRLQTLNALEVILLLLALKKDHPEIAKSITEAYHNKGKLIASNPELFKKIFDVVLSSKVSTDKIPQIEGEREAEAIAFESVALKDEEDSSESSSGSDDTPPKKKSGYGISKVRAMKTRNAYDKLEKKKRYTLEEESDLFDSDLEEENYNDYDDFDIQVKQRQLLRQGFQDLESTKEYIERGYYNSTSEQDNRNLVPFTQFWFEAVDHFADKGLSAPFLTQSFIYSASNITQIIGALSLITLSFENGNHIYSNIEGRGLEIKADSSIILFKKEIKEGKSQLNNSILVTQRFYDPADRYTTAENDPTLTIEKPVDEYLINKIYGCQVVVTNCSVANQEFQVLCEIPEGSLPIKSEYTRSYPIYLNSYTTKSIDYFFYFPAEGNFKVYPANVSRQGIVLANASESFFKVVKEKTISKIESLQDVLIRGSHDDILNFVSTKNIWDSKVFQPSSIYWLLNDKQFYQKLVKTLRERRYFDYVIWSFSVQHKAVESLTEFLEHERTHSILGGYFNYINSSLLKVDNFKLLEFHPMINSRVHLLANEKSNIMNIQLKEQYQAYISYLCELNELAPQHRLGLVYYLLLQDRIEEAIKIFAEIDSKTVFAEKTINLQYDYFTAYLDFYTGYPNFKLAREICEKYLDYPVLSWRSLFIDIANQLAEYDGDEMEDEALAGEKKNEKDRLKENQKGAAKEQVLKGELEGPAVKITHKNVEEVTVSIYQINLEILFSRSPFLSQVTLVFKGLLLINIIWKFIRARIILLMLNRIALRLLILERLTLKRSTSTKFLTDSRRAMCSSRSNHQRNHSN